MGIGPHKLRAAGKRGLEVTFDHFLDYGTNGPDFRKTAPELAEYMYGKNARNLLNLTSREYAEAESLLDAAMDTHPSPGRDEAIKEG